MQINDNGFVTTISVKTRQSIKKEHVRRKRREFKRLKHLDLMEVDIANPQYNRYLKGWW